MTRLTKIMITLAGGIGFLGLLAAAYSLGVSTGERQRRPTPMSGSGISATIVKLPAAPFVQAQSPNNPDCFVNLFGLPPDFKAITSLTVRSGGAGDGYISFYEGSGYVKTVLVMRNGKDSREWDFREDGSIAATTIFRGDVGTRQEFDAAGNPTKTSTIVNRGT